MKRAALPWVLCGLLLCPVAHAQTSADEQARIHFQAGTNYFNVADYEAALREYLRAYELAGRPALLHNIYLCHERLGNLEEAIHYLERYLATGGEVPRRQTLEQRLANMRRRLAAVDDDTTQAQPPPDEGGTPITEEEALSQPPPDGRAAEQEEGEPAQADPTPTIDETPTTDGTPPADEPPVEGGGIGTPALVSFVVAGVGVASFAVFGAISLADDSSLEDSCSGACSEDDVSGLRTTMTIADVSLGIGVAAAITGVVFLLTDGGEAPTEDGADLSAWLRPDGGGLAGRVAF